MDPKSADVLAQRIRTVAGNMRFFTSRPAAFWVAKRDLDVAGSPADPGRLPEFKIRQDSAKIKYVAMCGAIV